MENPPEEIPPQELLLLQMPPQSNPPDIELRKYELDRAHELELNKFAHALEVERLKILQLVNAGAFTVLLAFAAGLVRNQGWSLWLALVAGLSWVLGLAAAALATHQQMKQQSDYHQAYRHRRNAFECRRLSTIYGAKGAALMLTPLENETERNAARKLAIAARGNELAKVGEPATGDPHDERADQAFYKGGAAGKYVTKLAAASIALFVAGGILLAYSLVLVDPTKLDPPAKAAP